MKNELPPLFVKRFSPVVLAERDGQKRPLPSFRVGMLIICIFEHFILIIYQLMQITVLKFSYFPLLAREPSDFAPTFELLEGGICPAHPDSGPYICPGWPLFPVQDIFQTD